MISHPMRRILFIQNGEWDQPGHFATMLAAQGAHVEVIRAWLGEAIPQRSADWVGIAVGGGAMSAYELEEYPWLKAATALLQDARATGVPTLGMCLGAQLMAQAWGGRVYRNQEREIGFHPIHYTPAAIHDPVWQGEATVPFRPVSWHQDAFTLPPGAALLASSALTPHQLFRVADRHYGLQFHLEMNAPIFHAMVAEDRTVLLAQGYDPDALLADAGTALPAVEPLARQVFSRWLELTNAGLP